METQSSSRKSISSNACSSFIKTRFVPHAVQWNSGKMLNACWFTTISLLFSVFCYSWRFILNHILTATWVYQPSKTVPRPPDLDHLSLPDRLYHQVPQVPHHLPTKRTCKFTYFLFAGYILKNLKCNWKKNSAWIICNFQVCLSRKQLQCEAGIYLIKFTMNKFQGPVSSSNFSYSVYRH